MVEIKKILQQGKIKLKQNNIDISEARLLLAFVLNIPLSELMVIDECDDRIEEKYFNCIEQRLNGIPYAYIVGKQEFMKLPFIVTPQVLIPRADTEILVQSSIDIVNNMKYKTIDVLDMCTGSGCIAISLAKYTNNANVIGVDISEQALKIANENSKLNNTNIVLIQSNLFESIQDGMYDVIISNPPYIPTHDISKLQCEVQKEPQIALDGGIDGLDIYKKIIFGAKGHLKNNGYLLLEIGYNQASDVCEILQQNDYKDIVVKKDLSNNDRVIICRFLKK